MIQKAYADMGILGFQDCDVEELSANDEQVAAEFDQRQIEIERVAASVAS